MKAWQMITPDSGLHLVELPDPRLRGGGATLDVLAAQIPAYTDVLVAGGRGGFPTPIVLGAAGIGRVTATADDVFGIRQGDVVVATGLFRSLSPEPGTRPSGRHGRCRRPNVRSCRGSRLSCGVRS
jgi:NADPH:quinone reductase-like Zn-dependent oxidoreductase